MISPYEVKVEGKQYVFDTALGLTYEVRFTLFAIIDEFFHENEDVLLYVCDTSNNREAARNRLFIRWFKQSARPDRFTISFGRHYNRRTGILRRYHR